MGMGRKELVARLRDAAEWLYENNDPEMLREAVKQIEQDGKRIARLLQHRSMYRQKFVTYRNASKAIAEAVREEAAKTCYPALEEGSDDDAYVARSIYMDIRALPLDDIVKGVTK
jgi:hypothetical protein